MYIELGSFSYVFALVTPIIVGLVLTLLHKKPIKIALISVISYVLTVVALDNIFPLRFGDMLLEPTERIWFGFISPLFAGFDIRDMPLTDMLTDILIVYWKGIVFGIFLGFAITMAVKPARRIMGCVIYNAATQLILFAAVVIPNIFLYVSNYTMSSQFLMSFLFYFAGFGLAKLVLKLSPEMLKYIDNGDVRKKEEKIDEKLGKIV